MRVVRYSHLTDHCKEAIPFNDQFELDESEKTQFDQDDDGSVEEDYSDYDYWGLLVDDLVYPLLEAPYLSVDEAGVYRPRPLQMRPYQLAEVRLLAPVTPSKIACVGRNYAEHAAELGNEVPSEPLIFLKPPTAIIGPDEAVVHPAISERVDHEGELGVVIGRRCRNVAEVDALNYVFGYTIANDVTARDLQKKDGQWTRAKGFDTFAPVGPWVDTSFDPANRTLRCLVNGVVRQQSTTALMVYSIPRIIAHVSRFMTLAPGDLILTGTPSGIGPVQPGDVMTVEIEGLGSLSNPVVAEIAVA
jgi:2-keto-4-pentenoate hydratase/2-oxohepta-3-ene-1,7-dioic acid hydratase in catechol pathway